MARTPASRLVSLRVGAQLDFPLSEDYTLETKLSANVQDGLGVRMVRGEDPSFVTSLSGTPAEIANTVQFGMKFSIVPTDSEPLSKLLKLGAPGGARFEIGSGSLAVGIENLDALNLFVEGDLKNGLLELKAADGDGFIAMLLPAEGIIHLQSRRRHLESRRAVFRRVSSGLLIRLPVHIELGPIEIDYLRFGCGVRRQRDPADHRERLRREARAARGGRRRRRCPATFKIQR